MKAEKPLPATPVEAIVLLPPICWVERPGNLRDDIDQGIDYCPTCVKLVAAEYSTQFPEYAKEIEPGGCYEIYHFSDYPPTCERCHCMLSCSLSVDGKEVLIETAEQWCSVD